MTAQDSGHAPRVPMFEVAAKPIFNRTAVWLAAATLLWPLSPQQSCGCDRGAPEGRCCSDPTEQACKSHRSSARAAGRCEAVGKPRASCCCKSIAADDGPKASCCRKTATTARPGDTFCRCGSDCTCHVSRRPSQPFGKPATSANETNRRIELGQPLQAIAIVVSAHLPAGRDTRNPCRAVSSTAIDRCRALSRFTI